MAHWSSCATNNEPALPAGECDCGDDAPSEAVQERRRRGLSTEWQSYPGTGIEAFFDHSAVLYRIDGKIYAVPRQIMAYLPPTPELDLPEQSLAIAK